MDKPEGFEADEATESDTVMRLEEEGDIEQRIRDYTKCISKTTDNYRQWLMDEYQRKMKQLIRLAFED